MTTPVNGINPFNQATAAVQSTPYARLAGGGTSSGGYMPPPSKSSTSGVNTNIGVGETINLAGQAGKAPGIGRTIAFA